MNLKNVNIIPSNQDIKRKIIVPNKLNKELAELIGILTGDGSIGFYKGEGYTHYQIRFYGHKTEDFDYYNKNVNGLFKNLFNVDLKIRSHKSQGNASFITIDSKVIFQFLSKTLQIPTGKKFLFLKIPKYIKKSNSKIKKAFLRGLADTDASLTFKKKHKDKNYYPLISLKQKNKRIIEEVVEILDEFGFNSYVQYDIITKDKRGFESNGNCIYLNGKKNLERWIKLIGFNNLKHKTKYLIWKKIGYCNSNTTLEQRKIILSRRARRDSNSRGSLFEETFPRPIA